MISDKIFKSINHQFKGYDKFLNGQQIEQGYKPDFVLKNENQYVILESENSSSRKMYVGGMIKAAHFLQKDREGILVYVITPKKNTKVSSIAKHLRRYYSWIKDKSNLKNVYVIDAASYFSNNKVLPIDGKIFASEAYKV